MKRGRPRKISPIAQKMRMLVKQTPLSYEDICSKCDIRYNSFTNMFTRRSISKKTLQKLLAGNLITQKELDEHYQWVKEHPVK